MKEKLRRTGRLRDLISDAVEILDTFYQKKAYSNISRDAERVKERLDEWKRTKEIVFELHKDHAETKRAQDFYSIDFPSRVPADGSDVSGEVRFRDPDGDIQWAYFDVVEATDFTPFHFDPTESLVAGDAKAGAFRFYVWLNTLQRVTLRVTLVDRAGNASEPVEFTFEGR